MERLAQEWAEAERGHRPLCVLALDIDHFKAVNDSHGHDAGDAVLRQFADILRNLSRTPDVPCRFGGEEFLLIALVARSNPPDRCPRWDDLSRALRRDDRRRKRLAADLADKLKTISAFAKQAVAQA